MTFTISESLINIIKIALNIGIIFSIILLARMILGIYVELKKQRKTSEAVVLSNLQVIKSHEAATGFFLQFENQIAIMYEKTTGQKWDGAPQAAIAHLEIQNATRAANNIAQYTSQYIIDDIERQSAENFIANRAGETVQTQRQ